MITDLCRARVLVTEWIDGIGFEQVKAARQATRDHVGEIVVRFFYGSLYRFGQFSGDPHPGNFLLLRDGRVAFLDFGMTKAVPRQRIETELGVLRAALEHNADGVHAGLAALGFFEPDDPRFARERVLGHVRALNAWYANDEPVTLTTEYVSALFADAGDPRSEYWDLMKNETMPPDSLFASRMQAMTLAAVGQLSASPGWEAPVEHGSLFDAISPANHEPRTPTHETTHALDIDCEQYARAGRADSRRPRFLRREEPVGKLDVIGLQATLAPERVLMDRGDRSCDPMEHPRLGARGSDAWAGR